jgi:prepilin-type N-terminal cleavage/methylation domain-containing protein
MSKGVTLLELLVVLAIVVILSSMMFGITGGCSISDGTRVGTITQFSRTGIIWKTQEGELVMGGVRRGINSDGGSTSVANIWQFSVPKNDKAMIDKIQAAMDKAEPVRLVYHRYFFLWPWTASTDYLIEDVQEIDFVDLSRKEN